MLPKRSFSQMYSLLPTLNVYEFFIIKSDFYITLPCGDFAVTSRVNFFPILKLFELLMDLVAAMVIYFSVAFNLFRPWNQ